MSTPPVDELRTRLAGVTLRDEHRLRRRLKQARGGELPAKLIADVERSEQRVARRRAALPEAPSYPAELPVVQHREELLKAISENQVVVVAGETGSGKTTQLPKLCLELGRGVRGQIAHTQPRRLAARTVAQRIADELGVELGNAVGYSVRFNDRASEDTLVRLMTDGLLLAEIQHDRLLRRYDTIIIDEAHERSLNIDFLLGVLAQILPKRPELKLIITSATIDPERFAQHFGDAPIVEVSGRTYPVETRYRPPHPEQEDDDAIAVAVDELLREGPGDVLVFLSGEREIRDAAETLTGRFPKVDVLPLYARLSSAEQQRVFQPHANRRVVLATNVAETSLTVPGIRYVVDPGTARISRYSSRLKVQRLPIEPISQASANQRQGRCGRTSDGICVRLYEEQDFLDRPEFTDPEILRTSLASVILQMAALELGDVEAFPFLDPPDRRQVRDGVNLLTELGALDAEGRLTKLGRRLARLPVDPRLGRMVLEADRLRCAEEVIVLAAGLSIQDPRERPADQRAQADQLHARFADEDSDFTAMLALWRYWERSQEELSGSQLRKRCRREYLHFLRLREWQDLVGQLRRAARDVDVVLNEEPAGNAEIHQALLAGLLSHVGLRDAKTRGEYLGARGARFLIFPGSPLARRGPDWLMVAELVETSRLFGRTAAKIDPRWVEPLAEHLVTKTYSEPRWSRRRGSAVATERVTLYGLPVVTGRTVQLGPIEPELARMLFVRHALVEGDWDTHHDFVAENASRVEEVRALEDRTRRRDLLATEDARYAWLMKRVPEQAVSGRHFDRWWRDARRADPDALHYPRELLLAETPGDAEGRPTTWRQGDVELTLTYRFDPGSQSDGVTAHVPLAALGALRDTGFDWLVPGLRHEKVVALIRLLPKDLRRPLVPVPDTATEVVARLKPRKGRFEDAVARELEALRGVRVPEDAWDPAELPAHLRMTFRVEDVTGAILAEGQDLAELRARLRPQLAAELAAAAPDLERHGERRFPVGELPKEVDVGGGLHAYPAIADEGDAVGVTLLDTPRAQAAAMRAGTRRLLQIACPSPARWVTDRLDLTAQLALAGAPHATQADVVADCATAAIDALTAEAGGPAWSAEEFAKLRDHVAGELAERTLRIVGEVVELLGAARELERRLEALTADALQPARHDIARQLGRLVFVGFVTANGAARLPDVVRYLTAATRRAEALPGRIARDAQDLATVQALEADPNAARVRWELEELRVSLFAQAVGARGQVSAKRIRRALDAAR